MQAYAQKPKASTPDWPGRAIRGRGSGEHSLLHLQRTIGGQAVQRALQTHAEEPNAGLTAALSSRFRHDFSRISIHSPLAGVTQPKLAINEPGDEYEKEADHVSEQVMRMPEPALAQGSTHLPTKHVGSDQVGHSAAPPIAQELLCSQGQPLDAATRAFMEPRFGQDFSRVRLHADAVAEQSARDVNAEAYTIGNDVVFAAGQFAPETQQGRRLIAHELVHVVQQQRSQVTIQRQPATKDPFAAGGVFDQLDIVREGELPLEFYRRPEIRQLSFSERQVLRFRRKLEAIAKLGDLRDERAVKTLVAVVEDKLFVAPKDFEPQQKLLLQQEAVAALGKIGGPVALAKLNDLLNSKDPKERMMASRGFSGAAGGQAVTDLLAALKKEKDAGIKSQIISALGKIGSGSSSNQEKELIVKELIREMENNTGEVPLAAINALGEIKSKSATEALLKQLKAHPSIERLVQDTVRALGEIGDDRAVELLVIMLEKHGSKVVRSAAAVALGKIRGPKALAALKSALSTEKEPSVKADISTAIHGKPAILHWTFQ